jgi:hypothetical protein
MGARIALGIVAVMRAALIYGDGAELAARPPQVADSEDSAAAVADAKRSDVTPLRRCPGRQGRAPLVPRRHGELPWESLPGRRPAVVDATASWARRASPAFAVAPRRRTGRRRDSPWRC